MISLKQIEGVAALEQLAVDLQGVDLSALQQEVRLNLLGDLDAPQTGTAKWSPFSQITVLYAYFIFATPSTAQAQAVVKKNTTTLCTLTAAANNFKSNNFTANAGDILIAATDYLTVDLTSVQAAKNLTLTIGYKKWQ